MRSTFHTLETALRSLNTQQAALSTTGHNIANANTQGYSRQVVNMKTSIPIEAYGMTHSAVPGQLGTGVEFGSITRIREEYLDDQFRNENKSLGSLEVQKSTLEKLEAIVNEPSNTGIQKVLTEFWNAWTTLASNPEDITSRKIVKENALALTDMLNSMSKQLSDLKTDLSENIDVKVNQINTLTSSIATLNQQIYKVEGLGDHANDLRDQRDLLVDQLSKMTNVTVQETAQGYNINVGTVSLVNGFTSTPFDAAAAYGSGDLNGGEVHGMFVSRDTYVTEYENQMNTLANSLVNGEIEITIPAGSVLPDNTVLNNVTYTGAARTLAQDLTVKVNGLNGLHKLGYTLADPVTAGGDFFVASDGSSTITAGNISLNSLIENDPSYIASSLRTSPADNTTNPATPEKVIKGNNTLAVLMSQLKDTKFSFQASGNAGAVIQDGTVEDYLRSVVGQLGVQAEGVYRQVSNQQVIVDQVDVQRQSVSGVSLDEEMANMIKFQHAYNAAARVMTTVDQMLDKIINSMGVVGR